MPQDANPQFAESIRASFARQTRCIWCEPAFPRRTRPNRNPCPALGGTLSSSTVCARWRGRHDCRYCCRLRGNEHGSSCRLGTDGGIQDEPDGSR